jgi:hypothetical protein
MSRFVLGAVMVVTMLVSGPATYIYLGSKTSKIAEVPQKPTAATPRAQGLRLPGTLYLAQSGAIYSLNTGRFRQLTPEKGWMQPTLGKQGTLIVVRRYPSYSDLFVMNRFGRGLKRLTTNQAPPRNEDPGANHWAFYPKLSADGKTLWFAYDKPKFGYDVVMSIWAVPYGATIKAGKLWTNADDYSGGDVEPVPVRQGGVIYTKYSYGPDRRLVGQLYYVTVPHTWGRELTQPGEDCRSAALSPRGNQVAMICTYQEQVSYLVIASWNGKTLGPRRKIVTDRLVAQPTWAPDGSGIGYLAPSTGNGPFQLWFLPSAGYTPQPSPTPNYGPIVTPSPVAPTRPIQVTTNNGFDATSTIAWAS